MELNKANDIIKTLQRQLVDTKSKGKMKGVVAIEQEKLIDQHSAQLSAKDTELSQAKARIQQLESENLAAKVELQGAEKKALELQQIVQANKSGMKIK